MDQLMKVREYMMELAFESIRNGEDPYEHFLAIDSVCLIAMDGLREHGWARIEIDDGEGT